MIVEETYYSVDVLNPMEKSIIQNFIFIFIDIGSSNYLSSLRYLAIQGIEVP